MSAIYSVTNNPDTYRQPFLNPPKDIIRTDPIINNQIALS